MLPRVSRVLVPKTIKGMVFGTRALTHWVLGSYVLVGGVVFGLISGGSLTFLGSHAPLAPQSFLVSWGSAGGKRFALSRT